MAEIFEGTCQCGEVAYRVIGEALTVFACHCSDCQRQSSSAFGMALWVKHSSVAVLSGHLQEWVRRTPSGRQMLCKFCSRCGSRLFHQMTDREEVISIKPGSLKDTKWLRPVAHIWSQAAQPWVELDEQCLLYPGNPASFDAMFESWRNCKR